MLKAENLNPKLADISVIIPAYNRAALIGETLHSLLNQTVSAKEIIVVDDGSTDDTARVVERIAEEIEEKLGAWSLEQGLDAKAESRNAEKLKISEGRPWPEFKVIRQENAGPGAARNRGLAEATGEFIHFFDSDDIAAPNKHEVQLRALLETGADIAYGAWCKGRFLPLEKLKHGKAETLKIELTTKHTKGLEKAEEFLTTDDSDGHGLLKRRAAPGEPGLTLSSQNPFTSELARHSENTSPTRSASGPAEALDARRARLWSAERIPAGSTLDAGPWNFVPEGPVLQARGLPEGDLVRALLTNWSIVPHACLFRRSILEKAGGFPEDIWVGEDQLLFLRCLLAGAKVVHSPGTMVYYRLGNDPGKLTATGAAQKRHARDWGRFLLSAKKEIADRRSDQLSSYCPEVDYNLESTGQSTSRAKEIGEVPAEAQRRGDFLTTDDTDEHGWGTTKDTKLHERGEVGACLDKPSGAAFSNPFSSELARDSENTSLIRSADTPASLPATSHPLPATEPEALTSPSAWFGFRLRAYEAWRDLEKFFPDGENELKNGLKGIWRKNRFSGFGFRLSGFLLRKLVGLKVRVLGYREHASFRCGRPTEVGLPLHGPRK